MLGVARLGIHDNFFQSGGDSLKAALVLSRLSREFQVELPVKALFDSPTVAELAAVMTRQLAGQRRRSDSAAFRGGTRASPARSHSPSSGCGSSTSSSPAIPRTTCTSRCASQACSPSEALEQSLSEILRRHEALRTTFRTIGGQPVQVVSPAHPLHVPMVDLTRLSGPARQAEALRLASDEAGRPFHLAHGPLFRATLLKLDAEEHLLLITVHHIVSDGWSTDVLLRELETLYAAFAAGPAVTAAGTADSVRRLCRLATRAAAGGDAGEPACVLETAARGHAAGARTAYRPPPPRHPDVPGRQLRNGDPRRVD